MDTAGSLPVSPHYGVGRLREAGGRERGWQQRSARELGGGVGSGPTRELAGRETSESRSPDWSPVARCCRNVLQERAPSLL